MSVPRMTAEVMGGDLNLVKSVSPLPPIEVRALDIRGRRGRDVAESTPIRGPWGDIRRFRCR